MKKYIFFQTYEIIVDFRPMGMKGIKKFKINKKAKKTIAYFGEHIIK